MGIRLETNNLHQKFWNELTTYSNTYALSQLWLVGISRGSINQIATFIKENFEHYEPNWSIIPDITTVLKSRWFEGELYYYLARGVVFPGDSIATERSGVSQSGNIKGLIGIDRVDLPQVTITFLETNQSVVDALLRPWMILVGHMSLKEFGLRMPVIHLTCFQKQGPGQPLKKRKEIDLINAVPISIDSEEYNYTGDKIIDRQIIFTYTKYLVISDTGEVKTQALQISDVMSGVIPEPKVIDTIQTTPPTVLPGSFENTFASIESKIGKIGNIANKVLNVIPGKTADHLQKEINNTLNKVSEKVMNPIGSVISTGQQIASIGSAFRSSKAVPEAMTSHEE